MSRSSNDGAPEAQSPTRVVGRSRRRHLRRPASGVSVARTDLPEDVSECVSPQALSLVSRGLARRTRPCVPYLAGFGRARVRAGDGSHAAPATASDGQAPLLPRGPRSRDRRIVGGSAELGPAVPCTRSRETPHPHAGSARAACRRSARVAAMRPRSGHAGRESANSDFACHVSASNCVVIYGGSAANAQHAEFRRDSLEFKRLRPLASCASRGSEAAGCTRGCEAVTQRRRHVR